MLFNVCPCLPACLSEIIAEESPFGLICRICVLWSRRMCLLFDLSYFLQFTVLGGYDDVSARDNITPCQNIDDFNPYNYQDWAKVTLSI